MSLLKNSLFLIFQYLKCHFILNQQARPISMDKEFVEKFTKYKSKYATWNSANPENFSITIVFKATMTRDVESCQPFMAYCPLSRGISAIPCQWQPFMAYWPMYEWILPPCVLWFLKSGIKFHYLRENSTHYLHSNSKY